MDDESIFIVVLVLVVVELIAVLDDELVVKIVVLGVALLEELK